MLRIALTLGVAFAAIALVYHNRAVIPLRSVLLALGALQFLSLSLLAFRILRFFVNRPSDWSAYRGQWALITGASAGIGVELADRLAALGINIILVARRAEVLKEITSRLEATYDIKAMSFVADLSAPGELTSVASRFPSAPAVIIANGGGLATGGFKKFVEWKHDEVLAAQQLTSGHVYELLRLYLPGMIAKRSGRILFLGSISARFPQYIAPYAVEKARLGALALGLHEELRGTGVEIQYQALGAVLTPGYVRTAGQHAVAEPTFTVPSAASVASAMIAKFGGDPIITPHWSHALQEGILFGLLPDFVARTAVRRALEPFLKH